MDHPKTHPYRFHEYHPLKITLEKVFMQIGDKDEEKRDQQETTKANITNITDRQDIQTTVEI